jgi:hypothetical protein
VNIFLGHGLAPLMVDMGKFGHFLFFCLGMVSAGPFLSDWGYGSGVKE